jgi:hypothetical protein
VIARKDPLWLGLCYLAAIGLIGGVLLVFATDRGTVLHSLAPVGVLPCAALGLARQVRRDGGNVTQQVQQGLRRQPARQPRRYSRAFAGYLLLAYTFGVLLAVVSFGLTPIVLAFVVSQGLITAFVLSRTSWVRQRRTSAGPTARPKSIT